MKTKARTSVEEVLKVLAVYLVCTAAQFWVLPWCGFREPNLYDSLFMSAIYSTLAFATNYCLQILFNRQGRVAQ